MTWREDLRRVTFNGRELIGASFRGVPFFVEASERSGGRRLAVHQFVGRDDVYAEDMNRDSRGFRVDGYVIGDDYLAQKDALIAALEDVAGPGELVHPYEGVRRVACPKFAVRNTKADGGMATFSIEFVETPTQAPAPVGEVDATGTIAAAADAAQVAAAAELASDYDVEDLPAFALESAEAALVTATESLAEKVAPIIAATQELAEFAGQIELITARASSLVRQSAALLEDFLGAIEGLAETAATSPGELFDALLEVYATDLGAPVVPITATRARELANQSAVTAALRRAVAIEAARLAPSIPYESIEEALDARSRIADALDTEAGTASDDAYPALVALRAEVLRGVPGTATYAREITVSRPSTIPSLLLAYQLYGSVAREGDLVARNKIQHPGFVAGEIKALSDGE